MKKYGEIPEPGTIRFERLLPGPIERVWSYLTESDKKEQWLAAVDIELKVGGQVQLHFDHTKISDEEDPFPEKYKELQNGTSFAGRVTACDPPHLLCYTWAEESGEPSEVTYELFPKKDNKVLLVLTHRNIGTDREQLIGIAAGWHTHLRILADRLSGQPSKPFWPEHTQMEQDYAGRL